MRLLIFSGTGGAGTSTVAAATAVRAARRGVKTLLLTPEPPAAPGPLDRAERQHREGDTGIEVEPGLVVRTVDARARARRAWKAVERPGGALLAALGADPVEAAEFTGLPGLDDALTLIEIRDAASAGWDLVVVDAPPVARALRLLALPEAVVRTVDRALPLERRMLWAMGHGASPLGAPSPVRGVVETVERVQAELGGVRSVLEAPTTAVRLVLAPHPGALAAATAALAGLTLHGLAVDAVVVNRLVPAGDHPWLRERARAQEAVLAEADAAFAPLSVRRIAELPVPPSGADALADLDVAGVEPAGAPPAARVERDGEEFTLVLPLPLVRREDVELARRGDELVVDVAGERRVLTLPSVLRRCDVSGASLRDGALRVAFRPDPDLWRAL